MKVRDYQAGMTSKAVLSIQMRGESQALISRVFQCLA